MRLMRLTAFFIDLMTFTICLQIITILPVSKMSEVFGPMSMVFFLLAMFGILLKDGFKGRSFGKWMVGLKVLGPKGDPIGFGESLFRNLSTLAWPVEAVALLIWKKRLSDKVIGNEVVRDPERSGKGFRLGVSVAVLSGLLFIDIAQIYFKMQKEDSVIAMKTGVLSDPKLQEKVGAIKKVGWMSSAEISGGTAHFMTTIHTEAGKRRVHSLVELTNGKWEYRSSELLD